MNRILFLTLFALLLSSCQKEYSNQSVALSASEELLTFRINENTSNISDQLVYFYDKATDQELLFSLNSILNEVQVFELNKGQLVKTLPFEVEGERGVGNISGMFIHNLDSIFLFPANGNRLYLTDGEAERIHRIDYEAPEGYGNAQVGSRYFSAIPFLKGDRLITKAMFQGNYGTIKREELSQLHLSYSIDLKTSKVQNSNHTYPNDYWSDAKKHFQYSTTASDNGVVYSLWGDHNLYFARTADGQLEAKTARSQYFNDEWEAIPLAGDRMDRRRYFAASAHYGNIIYDSFRSVYYRFCYPKVAIEDEGDLRDLALFPNKFSILILDENLKVIGEEFFGADTQLVTSNFFVGKRGLYLSINHPDNPDNREDYLSFKLFELNK